MFVKTCLLAAAAATVVSAQNPDKPEIDPPLDRQKLEDSLEANLQPTGSSKNYWDPGMIPETCKSIATDHSLNPEDFTVFDVKLDDCDDPWIFCRHKDAGADEDSMVDTFSRVPVHLRQYIRMLMATPGLGDGAAAFTYNNGDCVIEDNVGIDTLLHEFSHSVDWNAMPDDSGSAFSDRPAWQDAYAQDSSTPTGYGMSSWAEDFAESGMVAGFELANGNIDDLTSNAGAIQNQINAVKDNFPQYSAGGGCDSRMDNPASVPKSDAAAKIAGFRKIDTSIKGKGVKVIKPSGKLRSSKPYHKH